MKSLRVLLFLFFAAHIPQAWGDLAADYQYHLNHPDVAPTTQEISFNSQFQLITIGGYGNEGGRLMYFKRFADTLRAWGFSSATRLFTNSVTSLDSNVESLHQQIRAAYFKNGQKPIIGVGHSRGGQVWLALILKHPYLVRPNPKTGRRMVERVIPFQAILGDNVLFDSYPLLKTIAQKTRYVTPGLDSLTTAANQGLMDHLNALTEADLARINEVLFPIVTTAEPKAQAFFVRWAGKIMANNGQAESDGFVAKYAQWIPGLGQVMGFIQGDHVEFVVGVGFKLIGLSSYKPYKEVALAKAVSSTLPRTFQRTNNEFRNLTNKMNEERELSPANIVSCTRVYN